MSRRFRKQRTLASLSGIALGSLLLPWFTDWVPFSLNNPMYLLVPTWPLRTWVGWVVASLDLLVLLSVVRSKSEQTLRAQSLLATGAILVLCVGGFWWATMPRTDLGMRMQALGPPRFGWSWLRWEFAAPLLANLGLLILSGSRQRPCSRSGRLGVQLQDAD